LAKVSEFSPGEVWLEGLRVDRRYRHRGVARELNLEVLRTVRRMKPRAVRFCTGAPNRATRHMAEGKGFKLVARLRYYWQKARKAGIKGGLARKRDLGELYEFVINSRSLNLTSGLIAEGWIFREFNIELLARYVKEKRARVIRKGNAVSGLAIYPYEENDRSLTLGFVDGDESSIKALAGNCMYLAAAQGLAYCSIAVPTRGYVRIVEEAGYRRKDSVGQVVYELSGKALKSSDLR
jgi:hypothetical protein